MICLVEEDTGVQQIVASTGIHQQDLSGMRIDPGEGILGMAAQRGAMIQSTNLARDGRSTLLRDLARDELLVASLTVPLQLQGRVLGTLTVISRAAREFSTADEQLLLAMATEGAVAVQNARLYEQEREHSRTLRAFVHEASARMTTALDLLDELLEIVRQTEPGAEGIARTRLRLRSLVAVQAAMSDDHPGEIDMKEAIDYLMNERMAPRKSSPNQVSAHYRRASRASDALCYGVSTVYP